MASRPIVNEARRVFEAARDADERAAVAVDLDRLRAARVEALASGAGEAVTMAPLGKHWSKSRARIDRGGVAGEDEARQCEIERLARIERSDNGPLVNAAARLGERFGRAWLRRRESASGRAFVASTREDIISIYRAAGIEAIQRGADSLLSSRRLIKSACKAAFSEVHKSTGRGGLETRLEIEFRADFKAHGTIASLPSSAPDQGAGSGLRPSVVGELASWGEQVRQAAAAKIEAASTPAAKGNARAAAARRVALIQGLFDYVQGGAALDPDLLAEFFDGGLTPKGHKRIQRMRAALV